MEYQVGIIGGTGLRDVLDRAPESDDARNQVALGTIDGIPVAFINRHGHDHQYAPHEIPYTQNILHFKELGIKTVIGTASAGIINTDIKRGSIVVPHDFDSDWWPSIYKSPVVVHVSLAEPYCPHARTALIEAGKKVAGDRLVDHGVYYTAHGPSFETKAKISRLKALGYDLVGMTGGPEAIVAREAGICYATIATGDNFACGIEDSSFQMSDVKREAQEKEALVKAILQKTIPALTDYQCDLCPDAPRKGLISKERPDWS